MNHQINSYNMIVMKRFFFFISTLAICCGCGKSRDNCNLVMGSPSTAEVNNVQAYLTGKGIAAQLDSRGFYYRIVNPGTGGTSPTPASNVTVSYEGSLPDGTIFDATDPGETVTFPLDNLILGWQYGIPIVTKGGVIDLYLPPSLAYGCSAAGSIPAGSMLIFRVTLVNF